MEVTPQNDLTQIKITQASTTDDFAIGDIYVVEQEQTQITKGLDVKDYYGNKKFIPHGCYEDYINEPRLDSTTEEKICTIILEDSPVLAKTIEKLIKEIEEENKVTLIWYLRQEVAFFADKPSEIRMFLTTTKDTTMHISTPLWISSCRTFATGLQRALKIKELQVYISNAELYKFKMDR